MDGITNLENRVQAALRQGDLDVLNALKQLLATLDRDQYGTMPQDVMLKIMAKAPPHVVLKMGACSHAMHRLSRHEDLWKLPKLPQDPMSLCMLPKQVKAYPSVKAKAYLNALNSVRIMSHSFPLAFAPIAPNGISWFTSPFDDMESLSADDRLEVQAGYRRFAQLFVASVKGYSQFEVFKPHPDLQKAMVEACRTLSKPFPFDFTGAWLFVTPDNVAEVISMCLQQKQNPFIVFDDKACCEIIENKMREQEMREIRSKLVAVLLYNAGEQPLNVSHLHFDLRHATAGQTIDFISRPRWTHVAAKEKKSLFGWLRSSSSK